MQAVEARLETPEVTSLGTALRRQAGMDVARLIGMLAVVALHVTGPMVSAHGLLSKRAWATGVIIQSLTKFAVPLFVMVSGALLLQPSSRSDGSFYRRRLSRIAVPLVVWTAVYVLFSIYYRHDERQGIGLLAVQLAMGRSGYVHLYFLWLLLGLYVLTPYLRVLVGALERRQLVQLTATLLIGTMADEFLRHRYGIQYGPTFISWCAQFLGYYLLGYVLLPVEVGERLRLVVAAFLGAAAATALLWWLLPHLGRRALLWPMSVHSPFVVVTAASAFLAASEIGRRLVRWHPRSERWLERLAGFSFGVYLVHQLFVGILYKVLPVSMSERAPEIWIGAWVVAITLASVAVVAAVVRIPYLRRIVGS